MVVAHFLESLVVFFVYDYLYISVGIITETGRQTGQDHPVMPVRFS